MAQEKEKKTVISQTLEAMLQQETRYHQNSNNDTTLPINTINHAVTALENIHQLCRLRHRDTLIIATSFLTRYLQQQQQQQDVAVGRLALICYYVAVKIHEPAALPLRTLPDLYRRFLVRLDANTDVNDAEVSWGRLELDVCHALQWRLNPPMAITFCYEFTTERRLRKRAQACLETAFRANPTVYCQEHRASTLAMAAVLLAEQQQGLSSSSCHTDDDDDVLGKALAFLIKSSVPTVSSSSFTPLSATTPSSSSKKNRKRCVTPTPGDQSLLPHAPYCCTSGSGSSISNKRLKTIHQPLPCLLWTGSPRSALSVAMASE